MIATTMRSTNDRSKAPSDGLRRVVTLFKATSFDDEHRELDGIATTPTVDRMGDIVEPRGARFALPIPLLWQHQHDLPVGTVNLAHADGDGIRVKARIMRATQSETLKKRLDEAWESVKLGLVRGLSIGFAPIGEPELIHNKDSSFPSFRYGAWEWLELSLVTIPANVDATIATVKSIDRELRGAIANRRPVIRLDDALVRRAMRESKPGVVFLR